MIKLNITDGTVAFGNELGVNVGTNAVDISGNASTVDDNGNIHLLNIFLLFWIFFIFIISYNNYFNFIFILNDYNYILGNYTSNCMPFNGNLDNNNGYVSTKINITLILFCLIFYLHFIFILLNFNKIMVLYTV